MYGPTEFELIFADRFLNDNVFAVLVTLGTAVVVLGYWIFAYWRLDHIRRIRWDETKDSIFPVKVDVEGRMILIVLGTIFGFAGVLFLRPIDILLMLPTMLVLAIAPLFILPDDAKRKHDK